MDDTEIFKKVSRTSFFFLIGYGLFLLGCALIGNALLLIIGSVSILGAFLILVLQPRLRQRVQRRQEIRQAALAGDTGLAPLAFPQPVPNEHALSVPFTIRLRPKVSGAFVFAGFFTAIWLILLLLVGLFSDGVAGVSATISMLNFVAIFFLVVFPFLLVLIPSLFVTRQRIGITDEGLTLHQFQNTRSIRWDEVKLFSINSTRKKPPVIHYLLFISVSSIGRVDVWRLQRNARLQFLKPALPFEEYDRQMDALLSLIAAKTGLPLYDLRQRA